MRVRENLLKINFERGQEIWICAREIVGRTDSCACLIDLTLDTVSFIKFKFLTRRLNH